MNLRGRLLRSVALLMFVSMALPACPQAARKVTKLADGVYAIEHGDRQDGFASGNTMVIVGSRQVFVVDSGFMPSDARQDIGQIRQWTDKPVSFVLNTHFHNDHNFGNRAYLDAFPAVTIIAHAETKRDMAMFGPGSAERVERSTATLQKMLDTGKTKDGRTLTAEEITEIKNALSSRAAAMGEIRQVKFQGATLAFDHDFSIDLGEREVQVKFLGRGNTSGDAVVYLPREKIAAAGDLIVHPIPYAYDGYPSEWVRTLENLDRLDAETIVPGHGPVMHDKVYLHLVHDLMKSAVDQLNARLIEVGPAVGRTLDDVKDSIDLSPFRQRFAGDDKDLAAEFDDMAASLIKVAFAEASLR